MTEVWRSVVGYEGQYQVSSLGRVRSVDRLVVRKDGSRWRAPGKVLKPGSTRGYLYVNLGRGNSKYVHQLVAAAFIGPRPEGFETCHNDGDPENNSASNLRYDTKSGNVLDTVRHGTHHHVVKTHCPHGHEYSAANTRVYLGRGSRERSCRTCQRNAERRPTAEKAVA